MLYIVKHPKIRTLVDQIRGDVPTEIVRANISDIAYLMMYEATRDLDISLKNEPIWEGMHDNAYINQDSYALVPILRAGDGMREGASKIIKGIKWYGVDAKRGEDQVISIKYNQLPDDLTGKIVYVLDPMLATGNSMDAVLELVEQRNPASINALCIFAAPSGIEQITSKHSKVNLYIASKESHLNEKFYIIPGMGDAGDKLFGTIPS